MPLFQGVSGSSSEKISRAEQLDMYGESQDVHISLLLHLIS